MSCRIVLGVALALVAGACGSGTNAPPVAEISPPKTKAQPAPVPTCPCKGAACAPLARDLERGHGVTRDYALAAERWACGCAGGHGDPSACAHYAVALGTGRGVTMDVPRGLELLGDACGHGDAAACALEARTEHPPDAATIERARAGAQARCDGGDLEMCGDLAELAVATRAGTVGDAIAAAKRACAGEVVMGCEALDTLTEASRSIALDRCKQDGVAPGACPAHLRAAATPPAGIALALDPFPTDDHYRAACAAGDLDGCDRDGATGDHRADACAAHDWAACVEIDVPSAARACEHGLVAGCRRAAADARDRARPDRAEARRLLDRACVLGDTKSCDDAKDAELGAGCAALEAMDTAVVPTIATAGGVKITRPAAILVWAPWVTHGPTPEQIDAFAAGLSVPLYVLDSTPDPAPVLAHAHVIADRPGAGAGDDALGAATRALGVRQLPELIVVDRDGHAAARVVAMELTGNHARCVARTLAR